MSMTSAQIDELRERAKVLRQGRWSDGADDARLMEDAADTIWQLRDDLQRANAENAKLRRDVAETSLMLGGVWKYCTELQELVREMHATISRNNSWWDCTCGDTRRFADRMSELGVEVQP